jgi:hypothetical protein
MGLLKIAVLGTKNHLPMEEIEHVNLEFGREGDRKPDAISLRCVGDREPKARNIGAQQGSHGEWDFARHASGDEDGLIGDCIDVCVAAPTEIVFFLRPEDDVEDVVAVQAFATDHAESVVGLVFGCEREQTGVDAVLRLVV